MVNVCHACGSLVRDLADLLDEAIVDDDIASLAAAIRRGDLRDAEYLLDKIAGEVPGWSERIAIDRYSNRAKAA